MKSMKKMCVSLLSVMCSVAVTAMASSAQADASLAVPPAVASLASIIGTDIQVRPLGGVAEEFAYEIKANVLVGSNECFARGAVPQIKQQRIGEVLHVWAVVSQAAFDLSGLRMCPLYYDPVYVSVTSVIKGLRTEVSDVIIHSVGEEGRSVNITELLVPTPQ